MPFQISDSALVISLKVPRVHVWRGLGKHISAFSVTCRCDDQTEQLQSCLFVLMEDAYHHDFKHLASVL